MDVTSGNFRTTVVAYLTMNQPAGEMPEPEEIYSFIESAFKLVQRVTKEVLHYEIDERTTFGLVGHAMTDPLDGLYENLAYITIDNDRVVQMNTSVWLAWSERVGHKRLEVVVSAGQLGGHTLKWMDLETAPAAVPA